MTYLIKCDGAPFNPCKGMTEEQAQAVFGMYAHDKHGRNGAVFTLVRVEDQKVITEHKVTRPQKR